MGYGAWQLFAPFHYLTANLHRGARCFAAFVDGEPVAFAGLMARPHPKVKDIMGVSRLVTLPDWQGLGLAFVLVDTLGAAYKAVGKRLHTYPAHPALIHGFDRSDQWSLKQRPGFQGSGGTVLPSGHPSRGVGGNTRGIKHGPNAQLASDWRHGSRPCAVFAYAGPALPKTDARRLLAPYLKAAS